MASAVKPYSEQNPVGLDGVEFIEYAGSDKSFYQKLFEAYGFQKISTWQSTVDLYRQGKVNFLVNGKPGTFADQFQKLHGPSVCSTGFRVFDADQAFAVACERGAKPYRGSDAERGACPFPAVYGIGDSLIYFVDQRGAEKLFGEIFALPKNLQETLGTGLLEIDHFTNNVPVGEMDKWTEFYTKVFNFREIRYFDIRGKSTGLLSRAMGSPCGKFAVPINEPTDSKSQIQEYLDEYKGSGIQHIALTTQNILGTLENLRKSGNEFLSTPPDTYYVALKDRLPNVNEDLEALKSQAILVDGDHHGYLLQIFSKNLIGPIFFEVIQRKNHFGFGEGNFQALFDAIEADQRERGYL